MTGRKIMTHWLSSAEFSEQTRARRNQQGIHALRILNVTLTPTHENGKSRYIRCFDVVRLASIREHKITMCQITVSTSTVRKYIKTAPTEMHECDTVIRFRILI